MLAIHVEHNGPIGLGHGGTAAGRFAALVEPDAATVRLHRPVPLGRPLHAVAVPATDSARSGYEIKDEDSVVATVRNLDGPLSVGRFPAVDEADIAAAERRWLDRRNGRHMAPTCFACGHLRHEGGLGLRPGPVDLTGITACRWTPTGAGRVPSWLVWAALDCPTGLPALHTVGLDEAVVTGELSVQVLRPVPAGVTHRLLSRRVGGEGRRHDTEAALIDPDGERLAVATATWVTVPLAAVLPAA